MFKIIKGTKIDAESISLIIRTANSGSEVNFDNVTKHYVLNSMDKGDLFFLMYKDEEHIGVISLTKLNSSKPIIRKLAVLPKYQNMGIGTKLLKHVENVAVELEKTKLTLGVREDKPVLIDWYKRNNFIVTKIMSFRKYPFKIVFMAKNLTKIEIN